MTSGRQRRSNGGFCTVWGKLNTVGFRLARQIKAMVLLDGHRPVLEGLTLGLWGGFAGQVIVRAYMGIDVNVIGPWMLIVTPIPVIAAAFCACYLPARRAAAVDPTVALRCE